MNLTELTCDVGTARKKHRAYRRIQKKSAVQKTCTRAFRAIARRGKIIDIRDSFMRAGWDDAGRPILAIARLSWEECWATFGFNSTRLEFSGDRWCNPGRLLCTHVVLPHWPDIRNKPRHVWTGKAVIPIVPPEFKHLIRYSPQNYHILWEADWEDVPIDPALLKHCGGNLYEVLATWDLTAVERAALR